MGKTPLSSPNPSEESLHLFFTRTHLNSTAKTISKRNSSAKFFYENIYNLKKRLRARGYPHNFKEKITFEVKFIEQKSALQKNNEVRKEILPLPNLKNVLMSKWHLIQDKPVLREIYNKTTIISFKRGKSLGDILIRAKL